MHRCGFISVVGDCFWSSSAVLPTIFRYDIKIVDFFFEELIFILGLFLPP